MKIRRRARLPTTRCLPWRTEHRGLEAAVSADSPPCWRGRAGGAGAEGGAISRRAGVRGAGGATASRPGLSRGADAAVGACNNVQQALRLAGHRVGLACQLGGALCLQAQLNVGWHLERVTRERRKGGGEEGRGRRGRAGTEQEGERARGALVSELVERTGGLPTWQAIGQLSSTALRRQSGCCAFNMQNGNKRTEEAGLTLMAGGTGRGASPVRTVGYNPAGALLEGPAPCVFGRGSGATRLALILPPHSGTCISGDVAAGPCFLQQHEGARGDRGRALGTSPWQGSYAGMLTCYLACMLFGGWLLCVRAS